MTSAGDTDEPDTEECVTIEFDGEETSVFVDGTTAGTTEDLVENSEAIVIGEVKRDEEEMSIEALAVVMGDPGSLTDFKGTVATEVSAEGTFDLTTEPGQGFAETLSVALQDGSIIFERQGGDRVEPEELETGMEVTVFGASDSEVRDQINAISVSVAEEDGEEVEGTITSVDGSSLGVSEEDDGITSQACVVLQAETTIQIVRESGESELVEAGTAADLVAGTEIEAKGNLNADGCIEAELIIVEIENEELEGTIAAIDNNTLTVTLEDDEETAEACVRFDSDTVVEIREEEGEAEQPGTPDDLATGMQIEASGVMGADGCIEADVIVIEDSQDGMG